MPNRLKGIDPDQLMLWKKVILNTERGTLRESEFKTEDLLNETGEIGKVFDAAPLTEYIHIVIKVPGK